MAYLEKFNLEGKTALITGAAGLLGPEHAKALLEVGCKVILTDISVNKLSLIKSIFNNEDCLFEILDVTSEKSVLDLYNRLMSKSLPINILINNAAINPKVDKSIELSFDSSRLENFNIKEWDNQLDVGLKGAFLCSKVFGSHMSRTKGGGVILNVSSDLSVISPDQRLYENINLDKSKQKVKPITYSVIKTGLIGMTKYLATYWAKDNVRCNAISPGGVFAHQDKIFIDRLNKQIPLGRMAFQDEYRSAIQFLCSDASSYMNGHNFVMDGGRSIW